MKPTYYRLNVSKIKYVECWRATRSWLEFTLVSLVKTFRVSSFINYALTNEGYERVEWNELYSDMQREFQRIREEFEAVGYRYCFCYRFPVLGQMTSTDMVLMSDDGNSCVSIKCERHQSGTVVTRTLTTGIASELSNGDFLMTCDRLEILPPEFIGERHPRYSVSQLAQRHRERIAESSPASPVTIRDEYEVERRVQDIEQRIFSYYVERGLLVPLTPEQEASYEKPVPSDAEPAQQLVSSATKQPNGSSELVELSDEHVFDADLADVEVIAPANEEPLSRYPGVVHELEKIKNKKGSWLSGAVILGISIAVFLGAGAVRWDLKLVLLLIPILLFHEMGHFIAMRIFKYRNMKMFFIPLLGAAVTGQNYNVPGWKKVVVSLAGPLPGIFVGCCMWGAAVAMQNEGVLLKAAHLTLFLNVFNLLPFLPLDGGWVVHVLIFSRHHVLDLVFRALAAVALILTGLLGGYFLTFIGVMMLLGLRSAYRVARVASDIRDAQIDTSSPDGQTVPNRVVDEIVTRLNDASPLPAPDALRAQQTLQVFESVNARPPGVGGTLALGGVYGGTFCFAIVFAVLISFFQPGGPFYTGNPTARYAYEGGTAKQWPEAAERLPSGTATTVIATYASAKAATSAFESEKSGLSEDAIVTLFGRSMLLTLKADEARVDELTDRFESSWATVDVAWPDIPIVALFDATFATDEQLDLVEQQANDYFFLPVELALIPPWDTEHEVSDQHRMARKTYLELANFDPYADERYTQTSDELQAATKKKDLARIQEIQSERIVLVRELTNEHAARLLERDDIDKQVVEVYLEQPEEPDANLFRMGNKSLDKAKDAMADRRAANEKWSAEVAEWELKIGSHMGQVPIADGKPIPSSYGLVIGGMVDRLEEKKLRFSVDLREPADAAIAFTSWLCDQGCTEIKYDFGIDY